MPDLLRHVGAIKIPDCLIMFEKLLSERGLSLDRLRALVAVHAAGGIAQAAPGDPVRQSQFSRQISELSAFFGIEVASRRGKLLKLTPAGLRLVELAQTHLRSLEDFRAECRAESVDYAIAAGDSVLQWLVIPRLGELLAAAPAIRFTIANLRTDEVVRQLTDGRVDLGIIRKDGLTPGLKSASLGAITYCAAVPTRFARGTAKPELREVLSDMPFAAQTSDGQFSQRLREIAQSLSIQLRPALSCQSFPQTLAAVRSGGFAAILPTLALSDLAPSSVAQIIFPALRPLRRPLVLAWNPRLVRIRSGAAQLIEQLTEVLRLTAGVSAPR